MSVLSLHFRVLSMLYSLTVYFLRTVCSLKANFCPAWRLSNCDGLGHVASNGIPSEDANRPEMGKKKKDKKKVKTFPICKFRVAVLSIFLQRKYFFGFVLCFALELLFEQPGWFALYQWRAEKGRLIMYVLYTFATHDDFTWRHRHRISKHKMAALTVVFSRLPHVHY